MSYALNISLHADRAIIRMNHLYVNFGPARKVRTLVEYYTPELGGIKSVTTVDDPAHPDQSRNWFATSHVWYMSLPDRVLRHIQPSLFNTLFA